jgi:hypothetical protein
MKTQSKESLVKTAYLKFREDNKDSLQSKEWTHKEDVALKLATEYDEDILRIAVAMSGSYARKAFKDSKSKAVILDIPTEPQDIA